MSSSALSLCLTKVEQALKALFALSLSSVACAMRWEPEETVEGSVIADDLVASQMIRKVASESNLKQLGKPRILTILDAEAAGCRASLQRQPHAARQGTG